MFRETNNLRNYEYIIWDWNGTLLNDMEICIDCINLLLAKRNLALLNEIRYRDIFTFPVKEYYLTAGFDFEKEPFNILAAEFIKHYKEKLASARLFQEAKEVLDYFTGMGLKQYIVSAMEQEFLIESVNRLGLTKYFDSVCGTGDHHAVSKLAIAKQLTHKFGMNHSNTCLIGDTLHDFEVATAAGLDCFLIDTGHQSRERLLSSGVPVASNLMEIPDMILANKVELDSKQKIRDKTI